MFKLSQRSLAKLKGVHPDLVKVVKRAIQITEVDFAITEGLRTVERQRELVKKGASQTMNSRHLTGHAIDLGALSDGKIVWDWPLYYKLADAMKKAAKELKVPLEWGGDWKTFKDGPHFQLPFNKYPKNVKFVELVDGGEVVDEAPQYTNQTEAQAQTTAAAQVATGAVATTSIGYEPVIKAVEVLTDQQSEFTSGDWLRMGFAALVLAGTVWLVWRKLK